MREHIATKAREGQWEPAVDLVGTTTGSNPHYCWTPRSRTCGSDKHEYSDRPVELEHLTYPLNRVGLWRRLQRSES